MIHPKLTQCKEYFKFARVGIIRNSRKPLDLDDGTVETSDLLATFHLLEDIGADPYICTATNSKNIKHSKDIDIQFLDVSDVGQFNEDFDVLVVVTGWKPFHDLEEGRPMKEEQRLSLEFLSKFSNNIHYVIGDPAWRPMITNSEIKLITRGENTQGIEFSSNWVESINVNNLLISVSPDIPMSVDPFEFLERGYKSGMVHLDENTRNTYKECDNMIFPICEYNAHSFLDEELPDPEHYIGNMENKEYDFVSSNLLMKSDERMNIVERLFMEL